MSKVSEYLDAMEAYLSIPEPQAPASCSTSAFVATVLENGTVRVDFRQGSVVFLSVEDAYELGLWLVDNFEDEPVDE